MRSEKDLHTAFMAWLKKQGIPYFHSRMDAKTSQACGDPDFVCVRLSRVAMVEFKHGKNKLSPAQVARIEELRQGGCETCVAYDLQTAVSHVEAQLMPGAATGHPVASEGASAAQPKLWLAKSRDLGMVVVQRNPEGHMGYIRLAKNDDLSLPVWTELMG